MSLRTPVRQAAGLRSHELVPEGTIGPTASRAYRTGLPTGAGGKQLPRVVARIARWWDHDARCGADRAACSNDREAGHGPARLVARRCAAPRTPEAAAALPQRS
jgi:hypothetical protein